MSIEEFGGLIDRNECENNPTSSAMIIFVATKSQAQVLRFLIVTDLLLFFVSIHKYR
jgi:hypothetical protein